MKDPSLIIYAPVRVLDGRTIVTNGDQTDTVYDFMKEGKTFADALRTRTFEPDAPNYTPRISAVVEGDSYKMSILKSADGNPDATERLFYEYEHTLPGVIHMIHTYETDGNPIPSFKGEPKTFVMEKESFDDFSDHLWEALNDDNKVSLFTRQIDLETGETQTHIYNKNQ
jgi:IMP cyclohydrolase